MSPEDDTTAPVTLPDGRRFDPHRPRSAGPLDAAELAFCRENAIPLAYDPAQIGWVVADATDDVDLLHDAPELPGEDADRRSEPGDLRFRPWNASDAALFVRLLDDPEIWRHLPEPYPDPLSESLARELIELSNSAGHHEVRAVEAGGETVGQVRLTHDPATGRRDEAEISYWLGRSYWGRGIGARMVARFTAQCFRADPQLRAIVARVHRDNPASARILEKAGYRREGPVPDDPDILLFRRGPDSGTGG